MARKRAPRRPRPPSQFSLAKRKAGLHTTSLKHMASEPDWGAVKRLNAYPLQRQRRYVSVVGVPRGRKLNSLQNTHKRTTVNRAQIASFNRYQTQQGMRANVKGSWNIKTRYID